jgi:hypothetical protein
MGYGVVQESLWPSPKCGGCFRPDHPRVEALWRTVAGLAHDGWFLRWIHWAGLCRAAAKWRNKAASGA